VNSNIRDYRTLTESEIEEWEKLKQEEVVGEVGSLKIRRNLFSKYSEAVRRFIHIFPNHYLDIMELAGTELLNRKITEFSELLEKPSVTEREILNHINQESRFFIIGSLLKKYFSFGHHESYIFREFPLGTSYRADYLLAGKNSDGWHFVFVELEAPYGNITLADGGLGQSFRKGMSQIENWDTWLESNFSHLSEVFCKYKKKNELLPNEFCRLDKTRINCVVVAGRRKDFSDETYRIQRKLKRNEQVYLVHYDNIIDAVNMLVGSNTY